MNLSIVIPVYRDTSMLEALCLRVLNSAKQAQLSVEIVLVEDSADKNEWQQLLNLKEKLPQANIVLVRLNTNVGQHYATWLGLMQTKGKLLVTMDADLQHIPESIPDLIDVMHKENANLVYGYGTEGHDKKKQISSWIFRLLSFHLNKSAAFYAKGYRLLTQDLFQKILAQQPLFASLDAPLQTYAQKISVINVPHQKRSQGISHYSTLDRWKLALRFILLNNQTYRLAITLSLLSLIEFGLITWISPTTFHFTLSLALLALFIFINHNYKKQKLAMLRLTKTIAQIQT